MPKTVPAIYRRATATATARAARIARAAGQLRAAKGGGKAGPPATPMRFPGWGGYGGYGAWRTLLPGASHDYEAQAGDIWQNSAVAACLGWIQDNFPEPTLEVVKAVGDADAAGDRPMKPGRGKKSNAGAVRVVADSKAVALLDRPNLYMTRYDLWSACALSAIVDGNAYLRKVRDRRGAVVQLWPIAHWMIWPRWDPDGTEFIGWYEYEVNGRFERIEVADIVHYRWGHDPRDGGRRGYSRLKSACRQICGLNDADGFTASILRNMGVPGIILSSLEPDGGFGPAEEINVLRDQFRETYTSEGRGTPMYLPRPIKVEKITFSPEELALDRIPSRLEASICALTGVNAMVVGLAAGNDHKTYSNFGESRRAAYEDALIPTQKRWAAVLTNQLLLPDFDEGDLVRWDYSGVQCLLENETQAADRLGKIYQVYQGITRAEFRQALGYDWTDEDEVFYEEAMLRTTDREDMPGEGLDAGGPNEVSTEDADAEAQEIDVQDDANASQDAEQALTATGNKKGEALDKKLKQDAIDPQAGSGRSLDADAGTRALSPAKTHKASSAEAILAHALKGRGWTGRYRDDDLTFGERHELLGDVVQYSEDWLEHEARQFFDAYGIDHANDEADAGRAGREFDPLLADPGRPDGPDDDRGDAAGLGSVLRTREPGGDDPADVRGDDLRAIDPAASMHLRRLFARARQFCREAHVAGAMALAGPAPLSADDLADLEQSSRDQDQFFDRFLSELLVAPPSPIDAGQRVFGVPMSAPQVVNRLGMYGKDIWGRIINFFRRKKQRTGGQILEARNLGPVKEDHCEDCPALAEIGYVPVGTLPAIGSETACGPGCHCFFTYKDT